MMSEVLIYILKHTCTRTGQTTPYRNG